MSSNTKVPSGKPSATIYQNETRVFVVFSPIDNYIKEFRGATINFENDWTDGAASGVGGFENKKELDAFIKENHFIKKGMVKLARYCYRKHEVGSGIDKHTVTCLLKEDHGGKCKIG